MSRPHAFVRRLTPNGGELVLMPPIDPLSFPYCERCKRRHDLADPTDRCGVHMDLDSRWLIGLALLCAIAYALAWWLTPAP